MALIPPTISHSPQSNPLYASSTGAWISPQINADAVTAGALNCDILGANTINAYSIYLRGASFVGATPTNLDFVVSSVASGFPVGSYVFFESGDGVGSFVSGFFNVGAGGNLQNLLGVTATVTAPVTAATVTFLGSILQIGWTGKVLTTSGYIRLTRCAI